MKLQDLTPEQRKLFEKWKAAQADFDTATNIQWRDVETSADFQSWLDRAFHPYEVAYQSCISAFFNPHSVSKS